MDAAGRGGLLLQLVCCCLLPLSIHGICGSQTCHADAFCILNRRCVCKQGQGDGVTNCTSICDQCDIHASCERVYYGYYQCVCNPGYFGNGYTCTRTEICGSDTCHPHAYCRVHVLEKQFRLHLCVCKRGYEGIGDTSCEEYCNPKECQGNAYCNGTRCICEEKFIGDGFNCKPTCRARPCHRYATCQDNNATRAQCTCQTGYVGDGIRCYELPALKPHDVQVDSSSLKPRMFWIKVTPNRLINSVQVVARMVGGVDVYKTSCKVTDRSRNRTLRCSVYKLQPKTRYQVQVTPYRWVLFSLIAGSGPPPFYVTTLDFPVLPADHVKLNRSSITSHSVIITIIPPTTDGDPPISKYMILVRQSDLYHKFIRKFVTRDNITQHYVIDGLSPGREYFITVTPVSTTSGGQSIAGNTAAQFTITTTTATPQRDYFYVALMGGLAASLFVIVTVSLCLFLRYYELNLRRFIRENTPPIINNAICGCQ